jgi:hypothetical protein
MPGERQGKDERIDQKKDDPDGQPNPFILVPAHGCFLREKDVNIFPTDPGVE